jgi:glycosyltransferase involved in cell wall biosynthesis
VISVIVNLYNMQREAARTLHSLSCQYQQGITTEEYEVIVVENGSSDPVGRSFVECYGPNFHYLDMGSGALPSPVYAVNLAVSQAKGEYIGVILDGARMATPGLLAAARDGLRIASRSVVGALAWHLGDEHQSISSTKGYSQNVEDNILASVDWQANGYRLYSHAAWAFSNPTGHFGFVAESCATFLSRELYEAIGGYDAAFALPGGGYANLDFFKRCCETDGVKFVLLIGEGTFHQYHGGATTGLSAADYGSKAADEYRSIRGCGYQPPLLKPIFFGAVAPEVLPWLGKSIEKIVIRMRNDIGCV